jgi:hypothetical protein
MLARDKTKNVSMGGLFHITDIKRPIPIQANMAISFLHFLLETSPVHYSDNRPPAIELIAGDGSTLLTK